MTSRLVGSDQTLLQIVEEMATLQQVGVTELANRLDLTKSTTHRHLQTLVATGYAVNDNGTYRLSHQWFHLGTIVRAQGRFYNAAKSEIRALADKTGQTVWSAIEEDHKLMFVDGAGEDLTHNPELLLGRWMSLTNTAAGKAILAHLPEGEVIEMLEANSSTTERETSTILKELEDVRTRGYAVNRGEYISGTYGLGMPVIGDDRVFGAISVASSSSEVISDDREYITDSLSTTIEQVKQTLSTA